MVALIDIPFVLPLANWIWGGANNNSSEDVTPEICLNQIPFNIGAGCFSQLVTKALGVAIIMGSCLNKIPIMINMMNAQSAAGISRQSLYGEAIVYSCGALYGYLLNHPFTAYGENVSLLLQNIILISLAWKFNSSDVQNSEKVTLIIGYGIFVCVVLNVLPESQLYLLMSSTWPVMLYARGSQIFETYQVKHTGSLSIATTTLNLVGGLIRVATTLKETGDMVVISGFILSASLSLVMFIQYWMYLSKTNEVTTSKQQTKKDTTKEKKQN